MNKFKRPLVAGIVAGLSITIGAMTMPAFAEPVAGSYVLVGSDTLQDSVNALTNGTSVTGSNVRVLAGGDPLGNFDAFGSANIQAKPNGPYFVRPAGSGDGRNALIASINGSGWKGKDVAGQVDIARSSSGPGSAVSPEGDLAYIPYGRDAVAYAYYGPEADLGKLTTAQLKSIYESNSPVTIGSTVVKPLIPQSSSGTRSFFLSAIGVTSIGSQASATFNGVANTLPENDASVLTEVGQIVPFSAASWVAQANNAAPSTIPASGEAKLGKPNDVAPANGTGSALVPNNDFYKTSFGRDTYLIVEYARIKSGNQAYDATLAGLVDPTRPLSLTNFSTASTSAGAVKAKFGFLAPASSDVIRAYPNVY